MKHLYKLLFLCLIFSSMQVYAFPHLIDYKNVDKDIFWSENAQKHFVSFKENYLVKMTRLSSINFTGFYANCPMTNYNVYVEGDWNKVCVSIANPDSEIEEADLIEYHRSEGFLLAYFDKGIVAVIENSDGVNFGWAEYLVS